MTDTRDRIQQAIDADPGIHFNELVRTLSLAPGQVQYHVHRLLDADAVVRHARYGRTHYFPPTYAEWERDAISLLRRETTAAIVTTLYSRGTARPSELASALDLPRSTLEHHLDHLIESDVVDRQYEPGNRVRLTLTRPAETAALLDGVTPHAGTRLVDRFERLFDGLFEDGR